MSDEDGVEPTADDEPTPSASNEPERTYGRRARIIAVVLLIVAVGATIAGVFERGLEGALEGVILLYVAGVLGYGVFTNQLETPSVQAAFGVGLGAYGVMLYQTGSGPLWLGLGLIGFGLAVYNGLQAIQER